MKYKIGVDVDGVIRNFSYDLYSTIKKHYPKYIKPGSENVYSVEEVMKEMTDWDLENSFDASREEIKRIYREEHADTILSNGTPFEDEIKTLKEEGLGATVIAKMMGIHRDSVYRLLKNQ